MEPYQYLQQVANQLDALNTRSEITQTLDELEFIYEAVDPEFQELASDLITRLTQRLRSLPAD